MTSSKPPRRKHGSGTPQQHDSAAAEGPARDTEPDGIAVEERQETDAAREHGGLAETDSRREKHRKPS